MKKTAFAFALVLCATALGAAHFQNAALPGFGHWSAKELRGYEKPLHEKVAGDAKTSGIKLADYGASNVSISHREANGIAEVHAQMDDYFVVQSGEGTLVVGGEVVNPKTQTDANETRGDSIKGGEKKQLLPGDVVHIPATMPHQLLVEKGKVFTYFVVKVKVR